MTKSQVLEHLVRNWNKTRNPKWNGTDQKGSSSDAYAFYSFKMVGENNISEVVLVEKRLLESSNNQFWKFDYLRVEYTWLL